MDPSKAHGRSEISIRLIKLCAFSIAKPLSILFINHFDDEYFPKEWKKANVPLAHKKTINN